MTGSTKKGKGGARAGAGRRPRRGSPMPKTGITAHAEQLLFYQLLSGSANAVSLGIQESVNLLVKPDERGLYQDRAELLKQAKWMITKAREEIVANGQADDVTDVPQQVAYDYAKDHYHRLCALYAEDGEG